MNCFRFANVMNNTAIISTFNSDNSIIFKTTDMSTLPFWTAVSRFCWQFLSFSRFPKSYQNIPLFLKQLLKIFKYFFCWYFRLISFVKYFVSFNEEWTTKYNCVKKSCKWEKFAFRKTYGNNFGIGYGGENNLKRYLEAPKHKLNLASLKSSLSFTDWGSSTVMNKLDEKVTQAELLFSGFIAHRNLSITIADHAGSMFRETFPSSKISSKYKFKRTKTTHVLTGAAAKDNIEELSKYLQSTWYGIQMVKFRSHC